MNAEMARERTNAAKTGGKDKVELALTLWREAITQATSAGKSEVSEADLHATRWAAVPLAARNEAIPHLQDDGFKVISKKVGGTKTTIVMW
ncbi:unnamed protein product [Gemmataceae bacterium]|nr:unnamed protein product [Gemmataceae bacterium]VTU01035.1 unnamed protein product [Gemmataceae bacterium]